MSSSKNNENRQKASYLLSIISRHDEITHLWPRNQDIVEAIWDSDHISEQEGREEATVTHK